MAGRAARKDRDQTPDPAGVSPSLPAWRVSSASIVSCLPTVGPGEGSDLANPLSAHDRRAAPAPGIGGIGFCHRSLPRAIRCVLAGVDAGSAETRITDRHRRLAPLECDGDVGRESAYLQDRSRAQELHERRPRHGRRFFGAHSVVHAGDWITPSDSIGTPGRCNLWRLSVRLIGEHRRLRRLPGASPPAPA